MIRRFYTRSNGREKVVKIRLFTVVDSDAWSGDWAQFILQRSIESITGPSLLFLAPFILLVGCEIKKGRLFTVVDSDVWSGDWTRYILQRLIGSIIALSGTIPLVGNLLTTLQFKDYLILRHSRPR